MHRFVRGPAPPHLPAHGSQTWEFFSRTAAHARLGDALYALQDGYCAYCECHLDSNIEHLERRSDCPSKTFDWNNLFFSCSHHDSCGQYKDEHKPKIRFNRADIVDPSTENPADFFTFTMTGKILPKDGPNKVRAMETIRVFHLDAKHLDQQRRQVGATIQALLEDNSSGSDVSAILNVLRSAHAPFLLMYETLLN